MSEKGLDQVSSKSNVLISSSSVSSLLSSPSQDVRSLLSSSHSIISNSHQSLDSQLLSSLPSSLSTHQSISDSLQTLSTLHSLLSSFSTSLSSASSQIKVLQQRSTGIDQRLKARERLEIRLNLLLSRIALEPDVVRLIFDTKPGGKETDNPNANGNGNENWLKAIEKLDRAIAATNGIDRVKGALDKESGNSTSNIKLNKKDKSKEDDSVDAIKEARNVAEACRIVASSKLLPHLLSLLSPLRTSVTSNHLILQSLILLKQNHPFYSFLARHSPRVAIDFQKGYASNARLYFETGFRRYRRSLEKLNKKGLGKWEGEERGGIGEIGSGGGVGNMFTRSNTPNLPTSGSSTSSPRPGSSTRPSFNTSNSDRPSSSNLDPNTENHDPWLPDVKRLENSKLGDGPGIVLAYQADESGFRATPEALFRSLALVFLDNACSEYVFIVRFFENAVLDQETSSTSTPKRETSSKKAKNEDGSEEEGAEEKDLKEEGEEMNPVALNQKEIKAGGNSRPGADEMWKQIMEPVVGHFTSFSKSLLTPQPPLLSLLTMLTLNDSLLQLANLRGCSSVLQSPLLGFKLEAWPIVQKSFEAHIESLKRINGASNSDSGGGIFGTSSWGMGGMMRAALDVTGSSGVGGGLSGNDLKENHVKMICSRYSRVYSSVTLLSDGQEDGMLSSSLLRLRTEIERLITSQVQKRSSAGGSDLFVKNLYQTVIKGLENGPAPTIHPRIQSELSHWHELERAV